MDSSQNIKTFNLDPKSTAASDLLARSESGASSLEISDGLLDGGDSGSERMMDEALEVLGAMEEGGGGFDLKSSEGGGTSDDGALPNALPVNGDHNAKNNGPNASDMVPVNAPDGNAGNKSANDSESDEEDKASRCSSSSTMSTATLIANGCMFTILEQFFTAVAKDDKDSNSSVKKLNVASQMSRIAVALEKIAEVLSEQQKSTSTARQQV